MPTPIFRACRPLVAACLFLAVPPGAQTTHAAHTAPAPRATEGGEAAKVAAAHPRLVRAVPAAASHVKTRPHELSVTFNESLTVALSRLTLLNPAGQPVTLDTLKFAPDDTRTLTAKVLGTMPTGRYTVKWQAAGADGHPMRGEYTFVLDADLGEMTPSTTGGRTVGSDVPAMFPGTHRPRGSRTR